MAIRLSEDKELVEEIRQRLKENDGYCPCRIEKNNDTTKTQKELDIINQKIRSLERFKNI